MTKTKQKAKQKMRVSRKTLLVKIANHPQLTEVLLGEFGLFCVGCPMAQLETLEQGALSHGLNDSQIEKLLKRLNSILGQQRDTS
jgi:hybrid cluster-associated redox disulfide protein